MSYLPSVTPVPAFHIDPTAVAVAEAELEAAYEALKLALSQLPAMLIQPIANAILNAMGLSSLEGPLATLVAAVKSALKSIPQGNVVNLIEDLASTLAQAILDGIMNALGISGTNHTVTQMISALEAIPQANIVNLTADVAQIGVLAQQVIDGIMKALGISTTGNTVAQLTAALGLIPNANILGALGPATIGDSVQTAVDALYQGIAQDATTVGNSFANLSSLAQQAMVFLGFLPGQPAPAGSISAITQTNNTNIANRASTKPVSNGVDPSADPVFPFTQLSGSSVPTIGVSAANTVIGFVATPDGGIKKAVEWYGGGTTNITSLVINVYRVNTSTGLITAVWESNNLILSPGVSNANAWNYADIPAASYITAAQGNYYAVEMQVQGTGTYSIAGLTHGQTTHPSAIPAAFGASRPSTLTGTPPFDAVGGVSSGTTSASENHTITGSAVIIAVGSSGSITGCTVGGVAATLLLGETTAGEELSVFGLLNPPTGTQTITATAASGTTMTILTSVSYDGVVSFGTPTSATATSTAPSISVSGAANNRLVNVMTWRVSSGVSALSGYSQNLLSNTTASSTGVNGLSIGDAIGASGSVTFSGTLSASSFWYSIVVPLIGGAPAIAQLPVPAQSITGNIPYSTNTPWFALTGNAGTSQFPPILSEWTSPGTFTYNIPAWANHFDIISIGGGGGASGGDVANTGNQGLAGGWSTATLSRAQMTNNGANTTVGVTVGGGGAGGPTNSPGNNGAGSFITITGGSAPPAGAYGLGGSGLSGAQPGAAPGNTTLNGNTYYGGGTQFYPGGGGNSPGGGGAGGQNYVQGANFSGGPGAAGAVFILAYQ